jgi:hypothetical protein
MLMDTFGRTPEEINQYIKELYNTPQIYFTENLKLNKYELHIKYPYSEHIFRLSIRIEENQWGKEYNNLNKLNKFINNLTSKCYNICIYSNTYSICEYFSIYVYKDKIIINQLAHETILDINNLDQIVDAFTKYRDMLTIRKNKFWD